MQNEFILESVHDRLHKYSKDAVDRLPFSIETKDFLCNHGLIENFKEICAHFNPRILVKYFRSAIFGGIEEYWPIYTDKKVNSDRVVAINAKDESAWLLNIGDYGILDTMYIAKDIIAFTKCLVIYNALISPFRDIFLFRIEKLGSVAINRIVIEGLDAAVLDVVYNKVVNLFKSMALEIDSTCSFEEGAFWEGGEQAIYGNWF